jgi:elongation factor 1 alpha-like protein
MGLLGGAPKMSKLAALAAARKQKAEMQSESGATKERAVDLLDELSFRTKTQTPVSQIKAPSIPIESTLQTSPPSATPETQTLAISDSIKAPLDVEELHITPSTFAQTLCSFDSEQQKPALHPSFGQPYATKTSYSSAGLFTKPSPDDVVLAAQSKGSLR